MLTLPSGRPTSISVAALWARPAQCGWNELLTTDRSAAIDFYMAVLGMESGEVAEAMEYPMLRAGGAEVAGVLQITPEMGEIRPFWIAYFGVDDVEATVAQAESVGATVYVPPTDIVKEEGEVAVGRFAHLGDPQGAALRHIAGPAIASQGLTGYRTAGT